MFGIHPIRRVRRALRTTRRKVVASVAAVAVIGGGGGTGAAAGVDYAELTGNSVQAVVRVVSAYVG